MDDRLERIVRGLIPGQKIAIYPLSTRYGDILTAYGERCETFDLSPVSLEEPFQAEFLTFDGATITVRTDKYPCLRINISDLENIVPLGTA
ncbi:MAG: hypothetical protein M1592_02645 [Candidatus Thermoplasmatota archaeon]|jgi:hypothetical protein|nr:hypothetical protein [Candidatus Thermoplasmatota archaeon]